MTELAQISKPSSVSLELGLNPGPVLRTFGMRRSGNHAIINWILRNAPYGQSVFLNNCRPGRSPIGSFSALEVNGTPQPHRKSLPDLPRYTTAATDGALVLVSYEDVSPAEYQGDRRISGAFDHQLVSRDVIIYRSFLNWAASFVKKLQINSYSVSRRGAIVLRQFERYRKLLGLIGQSQDGVPLKGTAAFVVPICYDTWFASSSYRADILPLLGLQKIDNEIGRVQRYGGGSSFQKDTRKASELETELSWRQMISDTEFQAYLLLACRDDELVAEIRRHFPDDADRLAEFAKHKPLPVEVE